MTSLMYMYIPLAYALLWQKEQVTNHPNLRKWIFSFLQKEQDRNLALSTSNPNLEQEHSSCWKIFKSRHNDNALMSVYMTNTNLREI